MRLLLVEDEKQLSRALAKMLEKEGYEVDTVYDGEDGYYYGLTKAYDLIIMDVMMPKMNGFEALSKLREKKVETPILMLTALADEHDKVAGLDYGADDYVAKPFSFDELAARIRALLRRRGKLVSDNKLKCGNATLDLTSYTLSTDKGSLKLTGKEFELARYFFEYPNFVATKDELITKVWGLDGDFESNNLEAYISFLRKKLQHLEANINIEAVRGVGYRVGKTNG